MSSIEALFPSKTLVKVLSLFLMNPDKEFYQGEIVSITGEALLTVQNALKRILRSGFIGKTQMGRMLFYKANVSHPAFRDLKNLFLKTAGLGDLLREALIEVSDRVQVAFVFGSFARGEEDADSDVDLFIVGDVSLKTLSGVLSRPGNIIRREINSVVLSLPELRKRIKQQNTFFERVISSPKIWLVGSENEFNSTIQSLKET